MKLKWDECKFKLAEPADRVLGVTLFGLIALEDIRDFKLSEDGEILAIKSGWAEIDLDAR